MVADQVLNDCDHLNQRMRYYTNNLLSGVFLLEWHWLYNYSSWYTKSLKMDVLQTKLNLTVTLNQRMPLLRKQSVLRESFSWNGTDYTTNQAEFLQNMDAAWSVLNLTVTPKPADAVPTQSVLESLFGGICYTNVNGKEWWISRTKLDCTLNQRMPLLHKQSVLESWNGTDYTTSLSTKNPSKRDVLLICVNL
jgi:hypothetical protein